MKIVALEAIPIAYPEPNDSGSIRHLLLVRLTADDGQVGWGEAVTMWREASLATEAIVDGLAPLVIGHDPRRLADIHAALQAHMWWYGVGGIASFALSAIDIALWDLAGKAENAPLMNMLGGAVHSSLPVLVSCHAMDEDLDRMATTMAGWVTVHQAVGIKLAFGKRGQADLGRDPDRDRTFLTALRRQLGPAAAIMVDVGATLRWDAATAISRTQMFSELGVDWVEEPLGADDPAGYAELKSSTEVRIAYGEREWTPRGIQRIVETGTVDVVGVDPGRCEGITGWSSAREHTLAAGVQINAHAWSSAIVTAASLALSLSSANCRQIEVKPLPNPMQDMLVATPISSIDGRLYPLTGPGLGITVDESVVDSYRFVEFIG